MQHFIVHITYRIPMEQLGELVPRHRAFLQTGYERGWLLMSGPAADRSGGWVVCRAPSLAELQAFFTADPYLTEQVADHAYIEFNPVKRQEFLEDWVTGNS